MSYYKIIVISFKIASYHETGKANSSVPNLRLKVISDICVLEF